MYWEARESLRHWQVWAPRHRQRIVAQLGKRIGAHQPPARIVEVQPALALRGIIECLAERREVRQTARQRIFGRRREKNGPLGQYFSGMRNVDCHNIVAPLPAAPRGGRFL